MTEEAKLVSPDCNVAMSLVYCTNFICLTDTFIHLLNKHLLNIDYLRLVVVLYYFGFQNVSLSWSKISLYIF